VACCAIAAIGHAAAAPPISVTNSRRFMGLPPIAPKMGYLAIKGAACPGLQGLRHSRL
jgi:hypothetical protein